jgi:hypothetical protein
MKNKSQFYIVSVILCIILLTTFYFFTSTGGKIDLNTIKDFSKSIIIELLGVVVVVLFVYYFSKEDKEENLSSGTIKNIENSILELKTILRNEVHHLDINNKQNIIIKSDFRQHNWKEILGNAKNLNIAVFYFDSWVTENWDAIIAFLKNGGRLRIVMTKTNDSQEMNYILRKFPKFKDDPNELIQKVDKTKTRLIDAITKSRVQANKIEIYHYPLNISYPLILIDNKYVVLSVFSNFNHDIRVETPSLLMDLSDSKKIMHFWEEEFKELCNKSTKIK